MRTRSRKQPSHRRGSTNVYADLGYRAPESMLVKAQLVSRIAELLAERGMTQTQAATVLGIPQAKLSKMLRGQFRGFSERKLMGYLTQLGAVVGSTHRHENAMELRICSSLPRAQWTFVSEWTRRCSGPSSRIRLDSCVYETSTRGGATDPAVISPAG